MKEHISYTKLRERFVIEICHNQSDNMGGRENFWKFLTECWGRIDGPLTQKNDVSTRRMCRIPYIIVVRRETLELIMKVGIKVATRIRKLPKGANFLIDNSAVFGEYAKLYVTETISNICPF